MVPRRAPAGSGARAAAVLFFVVLPIAVAIGVLVGKGNGNNDQGIADAIKSLQARWRERRPARLDRGDHPDHQRLHSGQGLHGRAQDAARRRHRPGGGRLGQAGRDLSGGGAVGIINTSEFTVTPAPPANTYVLYSGQFKSKAEATRRSAG